MELFDKKITVQWWEELLKDETKLITWLRKLQVTEIDGYKGNFAAYGARQLLVSVFSCFTLAL